MNILTKSILTTLAALAIVSTTHAETFPVFEDAAGTPTTRIIKKAGGTGTTMAVSAKSAAFVNFLVGSSGYSASQVTAARLVVYFPTVTKAGTLNVAVGTSAFQEKLTTSSITLASVPTGGFDTIPVDASLKKSFFIVDVTAQVKGWLDDPEGEFGFVITSDGVANCTIGAKEGSGSGYPAVLEVDIAGGSTADGTFLFNGGNVGIGTPDPAAKLHVFGTGLGSPATSGSTQSTGLVARLRDGGNILLDIGGSGGNGFWLQCTDGNNLASNFPLTLNPNGGNVGIGTTAPNATLDVKGGVKASGTNGYTFNSGDEDGGIFSPANGIITIRTENAERLRVDANGNVGIGTDNPT